MNNTYRASYVTILALAFLLPIFFIPSLAMPLGVSKVLLLTLASIIAFAALLVDSFKNEGVALPRHMVLWGAIALPLVYFVSGLVNKNSWLSLFGRNFEPGTAASILIFSVLFLVTSIAFRDRARLLKGYTALFLSLIILALFAVAKLILGADALVLKNFLGNMASPIGAWTDYAIAFGLLSILSVLALEMLPLRGSTKVLAWAAFALSLILMAAANFGMAWALVLAAAVVLLVYFVTVEKPLAGHSDDKRSGTAAACILGAVALLFVVNPSISPTGTLSSAAANFFGVSNTDVRPSLSTTIDISKAAVRENLILGSGPNTWGESWQKHKPADVNNTPFWNTVFPSGIGFLPTQTSSTGLLGTAVWALFLVFFLILGVRAFTENPEHKADRFLVISSFLSSLFLWIAASVYMPSMTVLSLAFIFTGFFVASAAVTGVIGASEIPFSRSAVSHFVSVLSILVLAAGTLAFVFVAYQKIAAAAHFNRAIALSNTAGASIEAIEAELAKAVNLSPTDSFWSALSQVELARANAALGNEGGTPEENSAAFQSALGKSIAYSQNAIAMNPSYGNWSALGGIYASLVPEPISVDGAADAAKEAYNSALARNPQSPAVPLLLARIELDMKNVGAARELIAEALSKKADYADAYFLLSQLEVSENNLSEAIRSAETGAVLSPGNAGVLFQLGLLKYANGDYAGAAEAFGLSLGILPDYANAKYYLGLSLDKLGRVTEATRLFENLAKTNPGNEAVLTALENLRAGRPAQSGSSSADAPPISQ